MPKKKQVIFQTSIQGKFIPRNAPPPGSVFRSGASDNRLNAKMAELFASSSTVNNENELVSTKSPEDNSTTTTTTTAAPEITSIDSSHVHSKLLHRRIVTMLETLKKPDDDSSTIPSTTSHIEHKSQPITFGQLRKATISSVSAIIIEDKPISQPITIDTEEKHHKNLTSFARDSCPDLTSITSKSSVKHQTNKERLRYSPSLEKLFQQQNIVSQTKKEEEEEEQTQKSPLTVDEILAMYYSKVNLSTNTESHLPSSTYPNTTTGFYIHPSIPKWNSSQSNQHNIPPPRLVLNEQNRNRPPPPSYSSSVAYGHRMTSTVPNPAQHLIHPSVSSSLLEHLYPGSSTSQHLLTENSSIILSNSSSTFVPPITNPINNNSIRSPPPRYKSPTSNIERSHSTLSSTTDSSISSQQSKTTTNNNSPAGFDRKFSRLLYGKDTEKSRRPKQRRKAFSDPVKKSVEEASRSAEKAHRRVTTHLNKTNRVKEEGDDETETETENSNTQKQDFNFLPRRRFQRQSDLIEKNRELARKALVPPNPLLKRRIPSFLRIYSQASSSNDILLQWHLFNLSELESFLSMMTRLYKNENLARVQLYEIYRTALLSVLALKTSSNTEDEHEAIATPL